MADDKTLSETIIEQAAALEKWKEMKPIVTEATSLVKEYSELIDGIGKAFTVVGFVWGIYSNMEKAKENAAQQEAMIRQITLAVNGMISRAVTELNHHNDQQEVGAAVNAAKGVLTGFRNDVLPYAKTYPLTGFDAIQLELVIRDARNVMETLYGLIETRAKDGDGAAILILYRNLHAVVQCKLTLNKWRHGLTPDVITEGKLEMTRLIQIWVPVVRGLELMSDKSFSQGIFVYFHVGGHGRPEFTKYAYCYQGELQGRNSNTAPVSQAFIEARKAGRSNAIPQELFEWNNKPYEIMQQLRDQHNRMYAPTNLHIESHGMDTYLLGNCLDNDQHWHQRTLRLDSCLGNSGGHFQWGGSGFTKRARNIRFNIESGRQIPVLRAELQDDRGNFSKADVNLAERINNRAGDLVFSWYVCSWLRCVSFY